MKKTEINNTIWFIGSKSISKIGDIMFDFANNTFLAGISPHSLSLVGIYQSMESIIGILFNLFGGVIADRFKRKKIIILTNFLSGLACIALSFISQEKWLIYAIVLTNMILAFLGSFASPTYKAFTKEIVKKDSIAKLNSFLETSSTITKVFVPLIAIFLYQQLGVRGVLILDGVSFWLAALFIFYIKPVNEEIIAKDRVTVSIILNDLVMGFKYILSHQKIFLFIVLSALVNFFLSAYNLLLPYSNQMFPNLPDDGLYGTFLTAEAIGGFLGAILSGILNKELSNMKLMVFIGLSGLCLTTAPFLYFLFHHPIALALSPALFSLFLAIFNIQFFSIVQRDVDNDFLGRVFGIIFTVAILFMPIGTGVFSLLLSPTFTYNLFFVGLIVVILALVFARLLKD
ncbi:TPA: MFS transporter [Streptococcus suis]